MNDDPFINKWPKLCRCGRTYTPQEFAKLDYVGTTKEDVSVDLPAIEYRNCPCASTITISIGYEPGKVQS